VHLGTTVPSTSTEGLPRGPRHVAAEAVEEVALLQLVVLAAAQEAEQRRLARVLARRRHVALVPQVPEPLEDPVVGQEDAQQPVPVRREEAGHAVGLRGPVQPGPLGAGVRRRDAAIAVGEARAVHLGEVEDVGLVVHDQPRAALVIAVHKVDPIAWRMDVHAVINTRKPTLV